MHKAKKAKLYNTYMGEHGNKVGVSLDKQEFDAREPMRTYLLVMDLLEEDHVIS